MREGAAIALAVRGAFWPGTVESKQGENTVNIARLAAKALLSGLNIALASITLSMPTSAMATAIWEAHSGDPCCGLPDDFYKYLDANEACRNEVVLGADPPCEIIFRDTLRNNAGPQTNGACVVDTQCLCGNCLIGAGPEDPRNFHSGSFAGKFTGHKTQVCPPGTTLHLGRCDQDTGKGKGNCPDCDLAQANPSNIASGNKYQSEAIYRADSLKLVLFYNSQAGSTYFQSGPFSMRWSSRYATRVRDSGQGIVGVDRPDGRELEFRTPVAGNVYVTDADVTDRLEKLTDASGALQGWRLTASAGDETFTYDAKGNLSRISSRALLDETISYSTAATPSTIAPGVGLPIGVTDAFGRTLSFTYDANRRIATMSDPAGGSYSFEYDGPSGPAGANNLTKVTFPDGKTRVYFYDEAAQINGGSACASPAAALRNALTGVQDENGQRFATWTYDCQARVTSSQHALGAELFTFSYGADSTVVVDPLNASRTVGIQRVLGVGHSTGTTQPAASGTGTVSTAQTYDANGNATSRTDFKGNRTNYTYDLARNLEISRTEALTSAGAVTPQTRTISTQWHSAFRLAAKVAEPLRITTYTYNGDGGAGCGLKADGVTLVPGVLCSKTVQATTDADGPQGFAATPTGTPRTWTYTYNANGSVLTVDGPRTDAPDITTYTYYGNDDPDLGKRGNVATIRNALGHLTSITAYNAHGQPLTIIDPNGVTINLTYDARQRLTARNFGGEVTSYAYDGVGQLTKVTLPDGSFISYTYDAAHRLTGMQDNLGNRIAYTLDAMGNRTLEQVFDPLNTLAQRRSRVYSNLNRLFQELGALNQTTEYGYDNQGNVTSVKDPLLRVTGNQYDALNRLKQVTDPALGVTQYAYNGLDALTQVTDPRNLVTGYTVNGLGNLTLQASPDTGNTINTYDAAGNLLTQTDAKGQVTRYAYDALNRVTLITFHDGSKQAYAYDQGTIGIGRLSSITETNAANQVTSLIQYAYTPHGRISSETRTVNGVSYVLGYSYDIAGRLSGLTYPSGRTVSYSFDALGRVSAVSTTKGMQTQAVVSSVAYHPFGGVKSYTLGNGQAYTRSYDQDGRISSYTLGPKSFSIGYDAASRIEFINEFGNPANTNSYGYDSLDRLTSAVIPGTPFGYSYDAVGNRLSKTVGAASESLTYSTTSNRIATLTPASGPPRSFVFDPNGSTTNDGLNTYAYDVRGRMVRATSIAGATSYQVNALGQRIRKANSQADTVFHYDTRGRLIAETSPTGTLKREYLYLGDIPVGVLQ